MLFEAWLEDQLVNLGFTTINSWLASHNTSWFAYVLNGVGGGSQKNNFSTPEIAILTENVDENLHVSQSKLTDNQCDKPRGKKLDTNNSDTMLKVEKR